MRDSWRHFVSEFIGTFALVFVCGAAIMIAKDTNSPSRQHKHQTPLCTKKTLATPCHANKFATAVLGMAL